MFEKKVPVCVRFGFALGLVFVIGGKGYSQVQNVPSEIRDSLGLDAFYQKYVDVGGLPVVGSRHVSDAALLEAAWIVRKMIGHRPDVLTAMAENKTRLAVMAHNEYTTDIPEHRHLRPRVYWDRRARGLGATPRAPAVSCAEENLLNYPGDPYASENICIHEFAHAIHEMGMTTVDPAFNTRLKSAFLESRAKGLWQNTYAITNPQEYWAEAVQCWFGNNRENDALHNHVNTRRELMDYDPALARLCNDVFGAREWTYRQPLQRSSDERKHLRKVDFANLPKFKWQAESVPDKPKVRFQTSEGDFELELEYARSPREVENVLRYVHEGFYSNGEISLNPSAEGSGQSQGACKVLQLAADRLRVSEFFPPILLASGDAPKLIPLKGVVAVKRGNGGAVRDQLILCWRTSLEAAEKSLTDPNWIVLGTISKGKKTLNALESSFLRGPSSEKTIKIQRAIRLN